MSLYVMIGRDGPDSATVRGEFRSAHVAYLDALDREGRVVFAGPIRHPTEERSNGAVIVFAAESLAAAQQLVAEDPYVAGGVYESYTVDDFRQAYPKQPDNR